MSLSIYLEGAKPQRRRPAPLAISLAIHGAAFVTLLSTPEIKLPEPAKSEYKQAFEGKEEKFVWFRFNKELPDVTPPRATPENRRLKAETKAPQEIVASRKEAPKQKQVVWADAPELNMPPVELPNVLAVRLPKMARTFTAPPQAAPPQTARIDVPLNAPEITQQLDPVKLTDVPKIAKPFVPPPTRVPIKIAEVAPAAEAPQLAARVDAPALNYNFKAPAKPFTAPPSKAPAGTMRPANPDAPPSIAGDAPLTSPPDLLAANSRELNLAVVGLKPANTAAALPSNSSPGQFSAGPKIRPEGADSAGDAKGVNVPDLFVRGAKDAHPDLIAQAYAAPTATSNLRAAARLGGPRISADADIAPAEKQSGAVKVSSGPDRRFDGRDVYMMAIQMPNLTSYSGSWLMWYADRTAREVGLAPIAPPIAHRKVDPKYIASAAADRVEGKVQLACVIGRDGRVSTVEIVRGLDERLDRSAEEALAKWEFMPATRQGEPIDVDVFVEIPFHLAPKAQVPY